MSAPEDNLPPVQPPSAGFLMQLFVVPLVIVVVIVMVSLMFNWLAHSGTKPADLVQDLKQLNAGSWQSALTIANLLTDRQNAELRRDAGMAEQLAKVLDEQLDEGSQEPERIKLRIYLALALGVFEIDTGLPTLIRAAETQQALPDIEVRKTAIEALARRADTTPVGRSRLQSDTSLIKALTTAAAEFGDQPAEQQAYAELRLRAAYTLGVIGGPEAIVVLTQLAADAEPLVRFNAATGLARQGQASAVVRLQEMLEVPHAQKDGQPLYDDIAQTSILSSALRAITELAVANTSVDLAPLRQAIRALLDDPQLSAVVRRGIEIEAQTALRQ